MSLAASGLGNDVLDVKAAADNALGRAAITAAVLIASGQRGSGFDGRGI